MPISEFPKKASLEEISLYKNFAQGSFMNRIQLLGLYLLVHKNSYQPAKVFHDFQGHHKPISDEIVDGAMRSALAKICTSHFLVGFLIF